MTSPRLMRERSRVDRQLGPPMSEGFVQRRGEVGPIAERRWRRGGTSGGVLAVVLLPEPESGARSERACVRPVGGAQ